jgi:hypothetical protein
VTLAHLDETGKPCTRHPAGELSGILHLAAIGARTGSYNHDIASKLQGVMMAVDEISELARTPDLQRAAETAHLALGELNQLLQQSRAMTKPPSATKVELRDLVTRAAQRVGVVLKGELPQATVEVAVPLATQGISLAIDAVSGTDRRRSLEIRSTVADGHVTIALPFAAETAPNLGDALAIASWVIARERGELRCSETELVLRLPVI